MNTLGDSSIEVQCILHTDCNLNCKFCFQNSQKCVRGINVDYIRQLPDQIVDSIYPIIIDKNLGVVKFILYGGELFSDNIPDSMFDEYRNFCNNIKNKLNEKNPGIKCKFLSMSNGIFTNHKRVENFLKEFNSRMSLSYDPCDRFSSDDQKRILYNTLRYFKDNTKLDVYIVTVTTKKNINACINGDKFFELLEGNSYVELQEYDSTFNYQEYLASDDDLFNFYKWAVDNDKFNISDIMSIMDKIPVCGWVNEPVCIFSEYNLKRYNRPFIDEYEELFYFSINDYYGKLANHITKGIDYSTIDHLGIQKRGCLMCDYYNHCSMMGWKNILFDRYELSECPIQRIYKYLDDNPNIVDRYKTWRVKHGETL